MFEAATIATCGAAVGIKPRRQWPWSNANVVFRRETVSDVS